MKILPEKARMNRRATSCIVLASLLTLGLSTLNPAFAEDDASDILKKKKKKDQKVDFAKDIRPILATRCVKCHGPKKQKGDLRWDKKSSAMGAIKPGKPGKSKVIELITLPPDDSNRMPAEGKPLTAKQKKLFKRWVKQGASWSKDVKVPRIGFKQDIKPILEKKCVRCHGVEKQKGDLRLDKRGPLLASDSSAIVPGDPINSDIFFRVSLPADDADRMPPKDAGDPLPKKQVNAIKLWIAGGARWPEGLVLQDATKKKKKEGPTPTLPPDRPLKKQEKKRIAKLEKAGATVMRMAQDSNWLRIYFGSRAGEIQNKDLKPLKKLPKVVELDLSGTSITDEALAYLKGTPYLQRLHLENTKISDKGLKHLSHLKHLEYLNLYGTNVSDRGLRHLEDLVSLRKIYVWKTNVTRQGLNALARVLYQRVHDVRFNRGHGANPWPKSARPKKKEGQKGEKDKKKKKSKKKKKKKDG